ncbi:MAG TPA: hypothetical protein DCR93_16135 [Cytophagales bacterium]|nr:hypothetical protein [Cytophagales bacterium]HAP60957.1 hypothetical protein [Cytophagales bacterium]
MEIRKVDAGDVGPASALLVDNFVEDRGVTVLFQEHDPKYKGRVKEWFQATLRMMLANGQEAYGAFCGDELVGIALTTRAHYKPKLGSMLRWLIQVLISCGWRTVMKTARHDQHRAESFGGAAPLIVEFIAASAHHRRKGIGKALLAKVQERAQQLMIPVWLETTKAENLEIFQRSGYRLLGERGELAVMYYRMMKE